MRADSFEGIAMSLRGRTPGLTARAAGESLGLSALLLLLGMGAAAAGDDRPAATPVAPAPAPAGVLRYRGTPVPGARVAVELEGAPDPEAHYRWIQFEGPSIALDDQAGSKIQFTVPPGARSLGFLLLFRDAAGVERTARVVVPIGEAETPEVAAAPASRAARGTIPAPKAPLRADAGDDQIGLVGRRITLNGGRSTPRGEIAYRWVAMGGPKVVQADQEEGYYSFVPAAGGIYRFGLIVASVDADGEVRISEPDEIAVTVGEVPAAVGLGSPPGPGSGAGEPGIATAAIDQMLRGPGAAAGRATLDQAAGVFDAIAARASLYTSFGELSAEMMRRLDEIVPTDPNWRQFWSQGIFAPLTQHLVSEMLAAGLDLRSPQGQGQALAPAQQERLERLFASYAREFRSRSQAR
ncbi:hypothetical protein [Paludisphaera mucosa]|uniref:Uncharacterized protein n=1 Tax=Paludisphaera mucosa TaxID=3030827 RepID=A0ABT6FJM7_9BACT|nr:hypothetical protein [Paludisphaera mucosa]MDG3007788.1 hypothetical protein [Paludisphaera mucosa]